MPKCGICNGSIGNTLVKHGEICEDDTKAQVRPYAPELDDLIRNEEESRENARQ